MAKKVIGIMSGTSLDGIDVALVNINEQSEDLQVDLVDFITLPYSRELRCEILECSCEEESRVDLICKLNVKLGYKYADAVNKLLDQNEYEVEDIDLIGSHGQTVYHNVHKSEFKSTLQIGSGGVIAEKTGITTVCNFRIRDIAAGGEGAPLVPYVDFLLYGSSNYNRVLQNIGGIGNYTYLPKGGSLNQVQGSDTGPGNMMIDKAIYYLSDGEHTYDHNGKWAAQGNVVENLFNYLLGHPFFKKDVPKSTGREEFGEHYVNKVLKKASKFNISNYDIITTLTAFTAYTIADAYDRFIPENIDQIIVGGGGSYNPQLMGWLRKYCQEKLGNSIQIMIQEDLGFSSEAKEAVAFAVLAYQTMKGRKNNVPGATGAKKQVILGDIIPGDGFYQDLKW